MGSLFERRGRKLAPTDLCRGLRGTDALHRGPVTALLAWAVERSEGAEGMFVTRVAMELLRPVPFEYVETSTRLVRRGRPVEVVESVLSTGSFPVARMIAVRMRRGDLGLAPGAIEGAQAVASGERAVDAGTSLDAQDGFHAWAVEQRSVRMPCDEAGRAIDWMRLRVPLLPDEPMSALCRVCAVADVGLGLAMEPPGGRSTGAPDVTVRLKRHPRGEWVCVERTPDAGGGAGVEVTRLFDRQGPIGLAHRALPVAENRRSRLRDSGIWTAERRPKGAAGELEATSGLVC